MDRSTRNTKNGLRRCLGRTYGKGKKGDLSNQQGARGVGEGGLVAGAVVLGLLLGDLGVAEALPEAERLVGAGGKGGRAVRREAERKDAAGVALEVLDASHRRVGPESELVVGVAVAREELLLVGVPAEGADLGARVDGVQVGAELGVPELDRAVGRARARGEDVAVVGAPGEGLDGGAVVRERPEGRLAACPRGGGVPEVDEVVVRARGERLSVEGVGETAYLLGVADAASDLVVADADVVVDDVRVAAPGGDDVSVPREGGDARPCGGGSGSRRRPRVP